jgi:hypothetical protein
MAAELCLEVGQAQVAHMAGGIKSGLFHTATLTALTVIRLKPRPSWPSALSMQSIESEKLPTVAIGRSLFPEASN